jgi:hypothetical protein
MDILTNYLNSIFTRLLTYQLSLLFTLSNLLRFDLNLRFPFSSVRFSLYLVPVGYEKISRT